MGGFGTYRELDAWSLTYALCQRVYEITDGFPDSERFGLVTQMRRCAVSVPSNIAEGWGRRDRRDFNRFLRIAQGSLCELDTQTSLAQDFGYADDPGLSDEIRRCQRVIAGLMRSLQ